MNPYEEKARPQHSIQVVAEFEELIQLAQQSAQTIDMMQSEADKARAESLFGLLMSYILLGAPISAIAYFRTKEPFSVQTTYGILTLIGCFISAILAIFAFYVVWNRLKRARYQRETLKTEVEIHQRLLSLIDQQKNRVETLTDLSPVMMATLDMKTMRLYRRAR